MTDTFDPRCRRCPRLACHLDTVRKDFPDYHARPVAPFGDPDARLVIVGLAPGMHGANATGRPFTGDFAGILLYETLYRFGFSNRPVSVARDDGLELKECRITNAVKCLPPQNKPTGGEIVACNPFLRAELEGLPAGGVVLALGTIAHQAVLKARDLRPSRHRFGHGAIHRLGGEAWLVDSYHSSRYNTQTGRLTQLMFDNVFKEIRRLFKSHSQE